ncbi:hypothetical protein BDA96_09G227900 [Sorghum bicolor]|uniref:Uncharacterized protein n=2 Tax=Sorghum bicolor TaxID=4558 RepID=A0A921QDE8_SORBI|nr:hypothetical protein BDA96_09G227900 [Sorghum bicolor]KXG22444.1 hypothetical protein SORBI_3009G215700 [Sorghum bicolor]
MASHQDKASYQAGETKARTETGQAMGATKDTAQHAKETTKQKASDSDTGSYLGQKTEEAKHKAGQTTESTKQKAGQTTEAAKQKAAETTEATKQKAGETTEATKQKTAETTEATKQKAAEAMEATKQKAAEAGQYAKETVVSGKDKSAGVIQQATEQVKSAAAGAKDAVMNTLGMGGDNNSKQSDTNTDSSKDSSTITRDH